VLDPRNRLGIVFIALGNAADAVDAIEYIVCSAQQ
jgi:hypothetical protein